MIFTYYIYKIIGTEWSNLKDEELCGAADTIENAEFLIDAMNIIDEVHREIRTESGEAVLLKQRKYYVYRIKTTETGIPVGEELHGIADTLENARELLREWEAPYKEEEVEEEEEVNDGSYWEIRNNDGDVIEKE